MSTSKGIIWRTLLGGGEEAAPARKEAGAGALLAVGRLLRFTDR